MLCLALGAESVVPVQPHEMGMKIQSSESNEGGPLRSQFQSAHSCFAFRNT